MKGVMRDEAKKRLKYVDEIEEWLEPFLADPEIFAEAMGEYGDEFEVPDVEKAFETIREALRLLL